MFKLYKLKKEQKLRYFHSVDRNLISQTIFIDSFN